jgi:hypothetical protein
MPIALEREDKERDAAFKSALHGQTATKTGGIRSMLGLLCLTVVVYAQVADAMKRQGIRCSESGH